MAETISFGTLQTLINDAFIHDHFDDESQFLLYNEDTTLDEIDLEYDSYAGIIVKGDLRVNGNIYNENTDGACSLIVFGDLHAKNMAVGGQLICVKGNVRVNEVLIGSYNHGSFYSYANVDCPLIISDDYSFNFTTDVKVLDSADEDDCFVIQELVSDDVPLFEDDSFNFYAAHEALQKGETLLKPQLPFTVITVSDFEAILKSPLFGPDTLKLDFTEGDWYISLQRPDADFTPLLIAINLEADLQYHWSVDENGQVNTYVKGIEDNTQFERFKILQGIVRKQEKWNEKNKQIIDQEQLWKLIWMFSPYEDQEKYLPIATAVLTRVLYAATFPFAYMYDAYKGSPSVKRALTDGLIEQQMIQEIEVDKPMGEQTAKLDIVTNLCWDVVYEIHEHYATRPIDRSFISDMNEALSVYSGALLRLDIGIDNYIIAGMHTNNIPLFIAQAQQFDIYPKYYMPVNQVEENALKLAAVAIEDDIRYNKCRGLMPYRKFAEQIWNYRYHEHGDLDYWTTCFENLGSALITKSTMVGTKVNSADFDFWWNWYLHCRRILDGLEES